MIQILNRQQFSRAAERLLTEHMHVSRHEANFYRVTNQAKGHTYYVRISRHLGHTFGKCTCEAGTPTKGKNRVPMVCKHLAAVVLVLRAVRDMRRRASH
jgi:uncharacterized Zn finger protein